MNVDATHLAMLFEHATEGIILTNRKGNIVLINPAAEMIFGYSEQEVTGKPVELLIPERFKNQHTQLRTNYSVYPQHRVMGQVRELYGMRKDGSDIPVEVSLSFYNRDQELFVVAFIIDITQRKKIEKNLLKQQEQLEKMTNDMKKLNAELESKVEERTLILKEALSELEHSQLNLSEALDKEKELNEIKSRFVAMASHEFRTPLSTILSSAALVSKYSQADEQEKRDRHIKRIKDAVKHLNDLLEDFLSLGRLEEGKVQVNPEPVELDAFLEEIIEEMKTVISNHQQISVSCDSEGVFNSDKKLLKNILLNLLSNASKFSAEDATVWINARYRNKKLVLSVKDEGIGISEEDRPYLFTSFFRGRNAINIQGTGLGLHIVKRYVELMNGQISLESHLNEGTLISLELPDLPLL